MGRGQEVLWPVLNRPVRAAPLRLSFDEEIAAALGVKVTEDELMSLYEVFVKEMILTRHLTRD